MADLPPNQPPNTQSYGAPLPYPDRHRPGQGQSNVSQSQSKNRPATTEGTPFLSHPARYSDYVQGGDNPPKKTQTQSPAQPPQDTTRPGPQQQPGNSPPWPAAPTPYTSDQGGAGQDQSRPTQYAAATGPGYGSGTFAMGDVAASLPQTSYSSPTATTYSSTPSTHPPPPPSLTPGRQGSVPSPQTGPGPQTQPQGQAIPPPSEAYNQKHPGATPAAVGPTVGTGATVAGVTVGSGVDTFNPPTKGPLGTPGSQQPYNTGPSPASTPVPQYAPTPGSPPQGPYNASQQTQYVSPGTTSQPQVPYQQSQPGQSPYQQPQPQPGQSPYQQTQPLPGQSPYQQPQPQPGQPQTGQVPYSLPPGQSPPQQYSPSPIQGTSPAPPQSQYMSGPPPIPGTTGQTYHPTPQTYTPPGQVASPVPSQPSTGSVRIDGKDYPIPIYTHTIQTPSQCYPALKEAYFGPFLRFKNVDLQQNYWLGSVLLVLPCSIPQPRLDFHPSADRNLLQTPPGQMIYTYANYSFVRYDLAIPIGPQEQRWTYAVTSQTTQTWEFVVAGGQQQWRFISWSCNDFSREVKEDERRKLGFGTMWKDVMERSVQEGGFHAQLGCGDQIYADRIWKEIPFLIEWLGVRGKDQRQYWSFTSQHEEIMRHTYFYYYTHTWSQEHCRDAMARIPCVFQIDDHDIFDGFGSYPHHLQKSKVFEGIGRVALEFYLLFQHHTTQQWIHQHPDPNDLVMATQAGWSFIKYFGPTTAIFGLDTRSERDKRQVVSEATYTMMFNRLRQVLPSVIHCIVMLSIPIVYPRLETVEDVLHGVSMAKKGVNSAFNLIGKTLTSVAPSGSATQRIDSGFGGIKKAFGKTGLMSSFVTPFGDVELLDDLMDHWTHTNHERERTALIRTLQDISSSRRIRMTFVSGAARCCGVGYLYDPQAPQDHKMMFQIITSPIVDAPPQSMVIKLLHNQNQYYIPALNSSANTKSKSDTKEEMMELFARDVDGKPLSLKKLLPRRNYVICRGGDQSTVVWELCVERGKGSETIKYGPIVVPRLQ